MKQIMIERKKLNTPQIDNADIRLTTSLVKGDVIVCRGCRHLMYFSNENKVCGDMITEETFSPVNESVPKLLNGMVFRCSHCKTDFIDNMGQMSIQRRSKDGSLRENIIQSSD